MDEKEKVITILRDLSGYNDITEESSLIGELGFDSLGMVALLIEIEDAFGIELEESDMNPFDLVSVSDVIGLTLKYTGGTHEQIS